MKRPRSIVRFVALVLLTVCVLPSAALAAVDKAPYWQTTIAGERDNYGGLYDSANALSVDPTGALYSVGTLSRSSTASADLNVVRWGDPPAGWSQFWSGTAAAADEAAGIVASGDGVYVGGTTSDGSRPAIVLLRYTPTGDLAPGWPQIWGEPGVSAWLSKIAVDGAGNVIAVGMSCDSEYPYHFYLTVLKFAPDGTLLWKCVAPQAYDIFYAVTDVYVSSSGVIYVCGGADPWPFVASISSSGQLRWKRSCKIGSDGFFTSICRCPAGGVYATGWTRVSSGGGALIARYTAGGRRTLTKRLGLTYQSGVLTDCAVDSKGRLAVCGYLYNPSEDFYVALMRPTGSLVWSHLYGLSGRGRDQAERLVIDARDRVTASGTIQRTGQAGVGVYAFSATGALRWRSRWWAPAGTGATVTDMVSYGSSRVWVCGAIFHSDNSWDQLYLGWTL
jgi:hypothetical protein